MCNWCNFIILVFHNKLANKIPYQMHIKYVCEGGERERKKESKVLKVENNAVPLR